MIEPARDASVDLAQQVFLETADVGCAQPFAEFQDAVVERHRFHQPVVGSGIVTPCLSTNNGHALSRSSHG